MFIIVIKSSQIEGVRNKANQQSIVLHFSLGLAPDDSFSPKEQSLRTHEYLQHKFDYLNMHRKKERERRNKRDI